MSKAQSNFRKNNVKRVAQALKSAGIPIGRVELEGGKVVFFPQVEGAQPKPQNPLDDWMATHADSPEGN